MTAHVRPVRPMEAHDSPGQPTGVNEIPMGAHGRPVRRAQKTHWCARESHRISITDAHGSSRSSTPSKSHEGATREPWETHERGMDAYGRPVWKLGSPLLGHRCPFQASRNPLAPVRDPVTTMGAHVCPWATREGPLTAMSLEWIPMAAHGSHGLPWIACEIPWVRMAHVDPHGKHAEPFGDPMGAHERSMIVHGPKMDVNGRPVEAHGWQERHERPMQTPRNPRELTNDPLATNGRSWSSKLDHLTIVGASNIP